MTAATNRFTSQEWSAVAGAPLLAAMWVLAEKRAGMRATLAVVSAYRDAGGDYDSQLLRALLATAPADAMNRPHDRDALRQEAPATLRQAVDIIERVGTAPERTEYRRFVLALAEAAARAAGEGGRLGRRRPKRTDSERDALPSITAILDR